MEKAYISIDGVTGSSTNAKHLNESEVTNFRYSRQSSSSNSGYLVFEVDKTVVLNSFLMKMDVEGKDIPEISVTLDELNAKGEFLYFTGIKFIDCRVNNQMIQENSKNPTFSIHFRRLKFRTNWVEI